MLINFDSLHKLKIFVWSLVVCVIIVEICMIRQFFSDLSDNNLINIVGSVLSIVLPFYLGYYYWEFRNQKNAIKELCDVIYELWESAKDMESKANNKIFLDKYFPYHSVLIYKKEFLQKEVSLLYSLGFYFDNVKWYHNQLYNLPIDFKQKIRELCKINLEIDDTILQYNSISIEEFSRRDLFPIQYGYFNAIPILKDFFKFLINNVDGNYMILNEIFCYLVSVS